MGAMTSTVAGLALTAPKAPGEPVQLTSDQQLLVQQAANGAGAILVCGGPASGKTTGLVATVVDQVRRGLPLSRVVALTGSRSAAQLLRSRIVAALGTTERGLQISTVHGWCARLLQRHAVPGAPTPRLLSAPEQELRVRELLVGGGTDRWPPELQAAVATRGFAREVRRLLARASQLGIDPEELAARGRATGSAAWVAAAGFQQEYRDVLDAQGAVDYADLVLRTRLLLLDDEAARVLPRDAALICCDEFAEADPGMIALLAQASQLGCRVIAFADPSTRVYGFRGASRWATADFEARFGRPGRPALRLRMVGPLATDPAVAAAIAAVAARLPESADRPAGSPQSGIPEGPRVQAICLRDEADQADFIAAELRRAHIVDRLGWEQMAVLTNTGSNAVATLARRLSAAGLPVRVAGDELALSEEVSVRQLLGLVQAAADLATGIGLRVEQAEALARGPMGGLDALAWRRVGRALRRRAQASGDDRTGSGQLLAREMAAEQLVEAGETDPELAALVRLRNLLGELVSRVRAGADPGSLLWRAWSGSDWPDRLRSEALGGGEHAPRANRDLDAVLALFDLAQRDPGRSGVAGVRSLIAEVAGQQIAADTARESDPHSGAVQVLTVHRSRGRHWRLVAVTGLQEGRWPAYGPASGLLQVDELNDDPWPAPRTRREQLADERRSFLLAISRASHRLIVTAIDDPTGQTPEPSRFLAELGVPVTGGRQVREPATLGALSAELRRTLVDPLTPPGLAQQAAGELAWLATQSDDAGRALVPTADPTNWRGLQTPSDTGLAGRSHPAVPRLSVSQIELLLTCPRRWFCNRRARADRPAGVPAAVGSVIHALIERRFRGASRAELTASLDELWPRLRFNARYESRAEYQAVEQALAAYECWAAGPDHARPLASEVGFELPLTLAGRQLVMVGTVDRLELDARGRVRVVDFKTGGMARSAAEVIGMDQLGCYQLAVQQGAFDAVTGGVRSVADAEVVYLRVPTASGAPTVRLQPSLDDQPALPDTELDGANWVQDRLAMAAGLAGEPGFPARSNPGCVSCSFRLDCPARIGAGR